MTLNNLAILQRATNRHKESEANYAEALGIRRKLAKTNPDAYLLDVAATLNNLAILQRATNRHKESEANFAEALEIYRKFAKTSPTAYLPDLIGILKAIIDLKEELSKTKEVEELKKLLEETKRAINEFRETQDPENKL
jgi:tetratricopeptide (TPR) repeat protein